MARTPPYANMASTPPGALSSLVACFRMVGVSLDKGLRSQLKLNSNYRIEEPLLPRSSKPVWIINQIDMLI